MSGLGDVDRSDPAALERAGDAAFAADRPALNFYRAALGLLAPGDPAHHRVTEKLNRMPWQALARQRRLEDAVVLLEPEGLRTVGMGYYAPTGAGAEALADSTLAGGDRAMALVQYWLAVKYYLLYAAFPGRGDSEHVGYGWAEQVLAKIEPLEASAAPEP